MNQAIRIHENGGPEVLRLEDTKVDPPGSGEVLIRHTAVGLNFIDIYQRSGLYPLELPKVLGMEGAGVIEETGDGVEGLVPGQRVAYAMNLGAYSQRRTILADKLVALPDGIEDQTAAAMMLKGMTVMYLLRRTHVVQKGETILVNAAAVVAHPDQLGAALLHVDGDLAGAGVERVFQQLLEHRGGALHPLAGGGGPCLNLHTLSEAK